MSSEGTVQRKVWRQLGATCRLFRLNTGRSWLSNLGPAGVQKLADGAILMKAARSIALGFADTSGNTVEGASDLIGWTKVTITPEMVGQDVAVFTAIETKASKGGKKRDTQVNFCNQVSNQGGIAGFANSEAAADDIVNSWLNQFKQK